ncbi:MAG TPA: hypothetical protein VGM69_11595 [Chloroflexota bacterium]|jgi:hypothetical protein
MQRFRFPLAVAATSLALVLGLAVVGGLLATSALAGGAWLAGPAGAWAGGAWAGGHGLGPGFALPPELAGLRDVPADQRFGHFRGVQVNLTDKDGRPLTIEVMPGTVTTVDATNLTITANDGSSKSYKLDDRTLVRGKRTRGTEATGPALAQNDKVVIVTLNGETTARAVFAAGAEGFGPPWTGHDQNQPRS